MKKARVNGFTRIHVLMGSKVVLQAIYGDFDWTINSIVKDIKKLVLNFVCVEFSYIPRICLT